MFWIIFQPERVANIANIATGRRRTLGIMLSVGCMKEIDHNQARKMHDFAVGVSKPWGI